MIKNMGNVDRLIRTVVAIVIAVLYFLKIIPGKVGLILLGLAIIFLLTSMFKFCPLYLPFGLSTLGSKKQK